MATDMSEPAIAGALLAIGGGITKVGEMLYNKLINKNDPKVEPVTLTPNQARQLDEIHAGLSRLNTHMQDVPNQLFRTSMTLDMMRETMAKQVEILSAMQLVSQMSAETLKAVVQDTRDIRERMNHDR